VNRSRSHFTLNPKAALELSSWVGLSDRHFWGWAKQRNEDITDFRVYERGRYLDFGFVRARTFKHLDWISPSDLGRVMSIRIDRTAPPLKAEFLFHIFMTPQNCDAIVGDLEERYKLISKKFGHRRADFWYCTQTFLSLEPIVWAWTRRSR